MFTNSVRLSKETHGISITDFVIRKIKFYSLRWAKRRKVSLLRNAKLLNFKACSYHCPITICKTEITFLGHEQKIIGICAMGLILTSCGLQLKCKEQNTIFHILKTCVTQTV
jgi:hypothetical protein